MTLPSTSTKEYSYDLPESRIAQHPLEDRTASKLMVYDGDTILDSTINRLPDLLKETHDVYMNNTRVVHARLLFDHNGKRIEVFCLCAEDGRSLEHILHQRGGTSIRAMVGGARKWKGGLLEASVQLDNEIVVVHAEKGEPLNGQYTVHLNWTGGFSFAEVLSTAGHVPLPPYMTRPDEVEDKDRYQTVYAEREGSVAAPTAGLHFDNSLLERLVSKGHSLNELTLHVGAGTFKPVSSENANEHTMHGEEIVVHKQILESLAAAKNPILAIGTTSMRTLESLYWFGVMVIEEKNPTNGLAQESAYSLPQENSLKESMNALLNWMRSNNLDVFRAVTHLYLLPGYQFRVVDRLFTNFHQPQSTLLMLVSAFIGPIWKSLYEYALDNQYRFLSYGDAMLLNSRSV